MNYLDALIAVISLVLIGINLAIVYRFWPEPWLIAKMAACTGLLTYTLLSVQFGDPTPWRAWIGLVAILVDAYALVYMGRALNTARAGDGILIAYRRR